MPGIIYRLSDHLIMLAAILLVTGLLGCGLLFVRGVLRVRLKAEHGKEIMDAYRSVVSLTALVLAFSLVQATANLRRVEADVRREASLLVLANQDLLRVGDEAARIARDQLVDYARAILTDEWPRMLERGRSERVDAMLAALLRGARSAEAREPQPRSARTQLVRDLIELVDLREARITAAALHLPTAFWQAATALALVAIVLGSLAPWTVQHLVSVAMLATALGVLVALVAIVDTPFSGDSAVKETEIRRALEVIARGF